MVADASQIWRTLHGALRNPELRRVQLAYFGFNAAEWGAWIAMLVVAYEHGGATTAGLVAFAQLVPAAVVGTLAGPIVDRSRPGAVLVAAYLLQGAALAATAGMLLAHWPTLGAYACAAAAATAVTLTRPAQAALVPTLARAPDDLTAANVTSGWIESLMMLAAPAGAGLLLAHGGAGTVFAVLSGVVFCSAAVTAPVHGASAGMRRAAPSEAPLAELAAVLRDPDPRALIWLLGLESMVIGALDVLYVVLALGLLHHGGSDAGYLNAAFGAGGVLGIGATVALIGRALLVQPLLLSAAAWSGSLLLVAARPSLAAGLLLLAVAGSARSVLDVAGRTLLQRSTDPEALGRVFGLVEGVTMAALAVGSLGASALVALAGGRGAFVGVGLVLPLGLLVVLGKLREADRRQLPLVELSRLRAVPLFSLLPRPELEALARGAGVATAAPGATVIRQGDPGDLFYLITSGEVDVEIDGRRINTLAAGDFFGEIALLRDVPRTATVTARTRCTLLSLGKEPFLAAVTGQPAARSALDTVVEGRLAEAIG